MQGVRFVMASVAGAVIVLCMSLLWPKVSDTPRPEILTQIYEAVVQTDPGRYAANVLGVADETDATPVSKAAASVIKSAAEGLSSYTAQAVTVRLMETVLSRFDTLSEKQQQHVREQICAPRNEGEEK